MMQAVMFFYVGYKCAAFPALLEWVFCFSKMETMRTFATAKKECLNVVVLETSYLVQKK
jgi:hypothetical protein